MERAIQIAETLKSGNPQMKVAQFAAKEVLRLINAGLSRRQARRVVRRGVKDTELAYYEESKYDPPTFVVTDVDGLVRIVSGDLHLDELWDSTDAYLSEKLTVQKVIDHLEDE